MVYGLDRVMNTMRLGVVLHMKFFRGIVVERLRFVKLNNVLDGGVVQDWGTPGCSTFLSALHHEGSTGV